MKFKVIAGVFLVSCILGIGVKYSLSGGEVDSIKRKVLLQLPPDSTCFTNFVPCNKSLSRMT
jgi:hypothetical protein